MASQTMGMAELCLVLLGLVLLLTDSAEGFHASAMCVQMGQANNNVWRPRYNKSVTCQDHDNPDCELLNSLAKLSLYYRYGYWTIGTRKFDVNFTFLDSTYAGFIPRFNIPDPDFSNGFDHEQDINDWPTNRAWPPKGRRKREITHEDYLTGIDSDDDTSSSWNMLDSVDGSEEDLYWKSLRGKRATGGLSDEQLEEAKECEQKKAKPAGSVYPPSIIYNETASPRCPYIPQGRTMSMDMCPDDSQLEIRTYAVKEKGGSRTLHGWLYVTVELKDPKDEILAVYVQVRDEYFNAIGEFVTDESEQCPDEKKTGFGQPTEYQVLPCSAVGFREAKVSNALFMARYQALRDKSLVNPSLHLPPDDQPKHGIRFTWKLSEYWCNRHLRFRPEALVFTKKMLWDDRRFGKPWIMRKAASYWLNHNWYGAADIKIQNSVLDCTEEVVNYTTGNLTDAGVWFYKTTESTFINDYIHPKQWTWDCDNWKWQLYSPTALTVPTFAGRCTHHFKKTPAHESLQGCNLNQSAPEFQDLIKQYPSLPTYKEYVNKLYSNRSKLCGTPCKPPTDSDVQDIKSFQDLSGENNWTLDIRLNEDDLRSKRVEAFFAGRKYHAALCTVWSMLLTSVGIFCARFLKETCMRRSCSGLHLWYWVHLMTSIFAVAVFLSSLSGIWSSLTTYGRSQHGAAVVHRHVGYAAMSLFGLMMLLGHFRCGPHTDKTSLKMRMACLMSHSVLGFMIYFLTLFNMINSAWIPASPTMGDNCDSDGNPTDYGKAFVAIVVWIAVDLFHHVVLNILQVVIDRRHAIKRRWYCPMLPVLNSDSTNDLRGSFLRKVMLGVYIGSAYLMTSTTLGLMMAHSPANHTCLELTGPTDCTGNGTEFGCSNAAMKFASEFAKIKRQSGTYTR